LKVRVVPVDCSSSCEVAVVVEARNSLPGNSQDCAIKR